MNKYLPILSALIVILLSACNSTKYVGKSEYLLKQVSIHSDNEIIPKSELKSYIRQLPNAKVLGLFGMQLGIYNLSGKDSTKWINNWLKRIGDEPIIYNEQLTNISVVNIKRLFYNRGFMNADVYANIDTLKQKTANVSYHITSNTPYRIKSYKLNIHHEELNNIAADSTRSLIKASNLFDSDILDKERDRITKRFRNSGHFNFTKDFLHFYADTTLNTHQVNLVLEMNENNDSEKSDSSDSTAPTSLFRTFRFNKTYIHTAHERLNKVKYSDINIDTIAFGDVFFSYEDVKSIRPKVLYQNTHILPGNRYSDRSVERTYSSLNSLSAVRYSEINIRPVNDSLLDCYISLHPNKRQIFSTAIDGTYSSGYWGIVGNMNYGHRNLFRGSETLSLQARVAYEYQGKGQHAYELGGELTLKFPTFLLPFSSLDMRRNIRATTAFVASFSYRNRPREYTGIVTGLGLKYDWSERQHIRHTIDLPDISYVYYPYISNEYRRYLSTSPYFIYNFQNHLIMKFGYTGSYSGYHPLQPLKSYFTYSASFETAGNLLHGLNNLFHLPKDELGYYKLFGIRYAQYIKTNFNLSYNQIFDKNNRIVYHVGLGVAIPYGNAEQVPFEKRYFSGGANSVRGWTAYQLGPGTFRSPGNYIDYNTQMGDIRIDMNMEYRSKLFWKLEGAFFVDAGNVWTIKEYETQPGGVFKLKDFVGQMGVAYGVGLRADFSFFILRLDLGVKLYNPTLSRTERWRTKFIKDDFALNLAIGYPF